MSEKSRENSKETIKSLKKQLMDKLFFLSDQLILRREDFVVARAKLRSIATKLKGGASPDLQDAEVIANAYALIEKNSTIIRNIDLILKQKPRVIALIQKLVGDDGVRVFSTSEKVKLKSTEELREFSEQSINEKFLGQRSDDLGSVSKKFENKTFTESTRALTSQLEKSYSISVLLDDPDWKNTVVRFVNICEGIFLTNDPINLAVSGMQGLLVEIQSTYRNLRRLRNQIQQEFETNIRNKKSENSNYDFSQDPDYVKAQKNLHELIYLVRIITACFRQLKNLKDRAILRGMMVTGSPEIVSGEEDSDQGENDAGQQTEVKRIDLRYDPTLVQDFISSAGEPKSISNGLIDLVTQEARAKLRQQLTRSTKPKTVAGYGYQTTFFQVKENPIQQAENLSSLNDDWESYLSLVKNWKEFDNGLIRGIMERFIERYDEELKLESGQIRKDQELQDLENYYFSLVRAVINGSEFKFLEGNSQQSRMWSEIGPEIRSFYTSYDMDGKLPGVLYSKELGYLFPGSDKFWEAVWITEIFGTQFSYYHFLASLPQQELTQKTNEYHLQREKYLALIENLRSNIPQILRNLASVMALFSNSKGPKNSFANEVMIELYQILQEKYPATFTGDQLPRLSKLLEELGVRGLAVETLIELSQRVGQNHPYISERKVEKDGETGVSRFLYLVTYPYLHTYHLPGIIYTSNNSDRVGVNPTNPFPRIYHKKYGEKSHVEVIEIIPPYQASRSLARQTLENSRQNPNQADPQRIENSRPTLLNQTMNFVRENQGERPNSEPQPRETNAEQDKNSINPLQEAQSEWVSWGRYEQIQAEIRNRNAPQNEINDARIPQSAVVEQPLVLTEEVETSESSVSVELAISDLDIETIPETSVTRLIFGMYEVALEIAKSQGSGASIDRPFLALNQQLKEIVGQAKQDPRLEQELRINLISNLTLKTQQLAYAMYRICLILKKLFRNDASLFSTQEIEVVETFEHISKELYDRLERKQNYLATIPDKVNLLSKWIAYRGTKSPIFIKNYLLNQVWPAVEGAGIIREQIIYTRSSNIDDISDFVDHVNTVLRLISDKLAQIRQWNVCLYSDPEQTKESSITLMLEQKIWIEPLEAQENNQDRRISITRENFPEGFMQAVEFLFQEFKQVLSPNFKGGEDNKRQIMALLRNIKEPMPDWMKSELYLHGHVNLQNKEMLLEKIDQFLNKLEAMLQHEAQRFWSRLSDDQYNKFGAISQNIHYLYTLHNQRNSTINRINNYVNYFDDTRGMRQSEASLETLKPLISGTGLEWTIKFLESVDGFSPRTEYYREILAEFGRQAILIFRNWNIVSDASPLILDTSYEFTGSIIPPIINLPTGSENIDEIKVKVADNVATFASMLAKRIVKTDEFTPITLELFDLEMGMLEEALNASRLYGSDFYFDPVEQNVALDMMTLIDERRRVNLDGPVSQKVHLIRRLDHMISPILYNLGRGVDESKTVYLLAQLTYLGITATKLFEKQALRYILETALQLFFGTESQDNNQQEKVELFERLKCHLGHYCSSLGLDLTFLNTINVNNSGDLQRLRTWIEQQIQVAQNLEII